MTSFLSILSDYPSIIQCTTEEYFKNITVILTIIKIRFVPDNKTKMEFCEGEDTQASSGLDSPKDTSQYMSGDWMENMMNMSGLIEDFRRAYLQEIPENTRPYDRVVRKYYNDYVNKWFDRSLKPNANKQNRMTSKEGTDRWYSYFEAIQARLTVKNWDLCLHCPEDLTNKWIEIFTSKNPGEIMKYGDKTGRDGYTMVKNQWDDWFVTQKYNRCFKGKNISEWLKAFRRDHLYFTHEQKPFDLDIIREKIAAIIDEKNIITYKEDRLTCVINENDPPYDVAVKDFNNKLILEFNELIKDRNIGDVNKEFWFFNEVKMIKASIDNWDMTYHPPWELVEKWLKIYDTMSVDEILDLGIRAIRDSMIIFTLAFDDHVTRKKYDDCYVEGKNGRDHFEAMIKTIRNLENYSYGEMPFPFDMLAEKIEAMLSPKNQPGPKRENIHRKIC